VVKTFTVVGKEKFDTLLVDHLGRGHSQSVLLAMKKLLKNSATLKGAHTHPPMEFPLYCYYSIYYFYILLYIMVLFYFMDYEIFYNYYFHCKISFIY
jgi:hypothetical protein